jgi:Organic radical activating enzymes
MPGGPPCSAGSPAATCGRAGSRTGTRPCASSATPISWAWDRTAAASPTPAALAAAVLARWPTVENGRAEGGRPLVVCTGGEPLLQLDAPAIEELHRRGFEVAVETNGTQPAPPGLDHICVSPKANAPLTLERGDELKLVYPQLHADAQPEHFAGLAFSAFFLQPMDTGDEAGTRANTKAALAYCLAHPQWRLSLQTHKLLEIR